GAAAAAFAGLAGVRLMVLFPEGRISAVQRRFMTTTGADNIRCVAVEGDFDACQAMVKALFADAIFAREVALGAVNSINFARIAAQSVYYFVAGVALGAPEKPSAFVVPTGNFGDAYAGWAAARMGLPVSRLVVATNANAIVARALNEGVYRRGPAIATQSPAMDIQVASNFERLYFEYADRDAGRTAAALAAFDSRGEIILPPEMRTALADRFSGVSVDEAATTEAMRRIWAKSSVVVDPHTAVALAAADRIGSRDGTTVVLSTAHPAKFPEAVAAAGLTPDQDRVTALAALPERLDRLPANLEAVKAYVRGWHA
ncbi:MAG TPA: threonine synthase, partial [Caulobacteraceae bacterium]